MDRREALRRTALLMGGALSAPSILGIMQGCTAKPEINWKPEFLSMEQAETITRLADIIIPKTDTPGAVDVGVPGFIDRMLRDVYSKDDQDTFFKGLAEFEQHVSTKTGSSFSQLDEEEQEAVVLSVHEEAITAAREAGSAPRPFLLKVKELTMLGFFTSEVGATQVLQYAPVPGAYKGCVPLTEAGNGKTWAT